MPTSRWTDAGKALARLSKDCDGLGGAGALVGAYVALIAGVAARAASRSIRRGRCHGLQAPTAPLGLAVKTDGAAVAVSGVTESFIIARNAAEGVMYQDGRIRGVTATVKVFSDLFAEVLAIIVNFMDALYQPEFQPCAA